MGSEMCIRDRCSSTVLKHLDSDLTWPGCQEDYLSALHKQCSSTVLKHLDSDLTWPGCQEDDLSALRKQCSSTVLKHLDNDLTWPGCQEDYLSALCKQCSSTVLKHLDSNREDWETMMGNGPGWSKLWNDSWQWAKHAWLYSDLLQAFSFC